VLLPTGSGRERVRVRSTHQRRSQPTPAYRCSHRNSYRQRAAATRLRARLATRLVSPRRDVEPKWRCPDRWVAHRAGRYLRRLFTRCKPAATFEPGVEATPVLCPRASPQGCPPTPEPRAARALPLRPAGCSHHDRGHALHAATPPSIPRLRRLPELRVQDRSGPCCDTTSGWAVHATQPKTVRQQVCPGSPTLRRPGDLGLLAPGLYRGLLRSGGTPAGPVTHPHTYNHNGSSAAHPHSAAYGNFSGSPGRLTGTRRDIYDVTHKLRLPSGLRCPSGSIRPRG